MAKAIKPKSKEKEVLRVPKELISAKEFTRRESIYEQYYQRVREGEVSRKFFKQREALQNGDMATFKKLQEEIADVRFNEKMIPAPPFPNPQIESVYGRLGVSEYWEQKIQEAKEKGVEIKTVG